MTTHVPTSLGRGLSLLVPVTIDTGPTRNHHRRSPARRHVPHKDCLGVVATQLPLGLSSEGSFGSHPLMPCQPSDFDGPVFLDEEVIRTTPASSSSARCMAALGVREQQQYSLAAFPIQLPPQ